MGKWMAVVGGVCLLIGLALLAPFDEIFILIPLVAFFGIAVIPVFYAISFFILVIGCVLLGVHIVPLLLSHPAGIAVLVLVFLIVIYLLISGGLT